MGITVQYLFDVFVTVLCRTGNSTCSSAQITWWTRQTYWWRLSKMHWNSSWCGHCRRHLWKCHRHPVNEQWSRFMSVCCNHRSTVFLVRVVFLITRKLCSSSEHPVTCFSSLCKFVMIVYLLRELVIKCFCIYARGKTMSHVSVLLFVSLKIVMASRWSSLT